MIPYFGLSRTSSVISFYEKSNAGIFAQEVSEVLVQIREFSSMKFYQVEATRLGYAKLTYLHSIHSPESRIDCTYFIFFFSGQCAYFIIIPIN